MYRIVKHSRRTSAEIYSHLVDTTQHKHKKVPEDRDLTLEQHEERQRRLLSGEYHREKKSERIFRKLKAPTKYNLQKLDEEKVRNLMSGAGSTETAGDVSANDSATELAQLQNETKFNQLEAYEIDMDTIQEYHKLEEDYQMDIADYWKKDSKHDLHKYSEPAPLPPTRYPEELKNMPTMPATQNAAWYGTEGWDAPIWKPEKLEDRLEKFERRRRDLPDSYTVAGRELRVVPNPVSGGMVAKYIDTHGPVAEMAKRAAGRVARQWSNLDRNDNIYEARTKVKANILASINNANSILQYDNMQLRVMKVRDEMDGQRQWKRDVAKHGVDHNVRHWVDVMKGSYRMKVVGIEESKVHNNWHLTFGSGNNILKEYLTKDEFEQEIRAGNQRTVMNDSDLMNNLWGQEHFFIEALDFRYSLIDSDGLSRMDGLRHLAYLNLEGCRFIDDEAMTKMHYFSETLEYLDLSNTRITMRGFNFIHLLKNLRWLNLSNMIDISDEEIKDLIPLLRAVLPPDCTIVTSYQSDPETPLLSSPEEPDLNQKFTTSVDSESENAIVLFEKDGMICQDVHKLWNVKPWMEDKQQSRRKEDLIKANDKFDRMTTTGFMQYVNRANTMKPLY